jgi:hypothetical protein
MGICTLRATRKKGGEERKGEREEAKDCHPVEFEVNSRLIVKT